jgi:predicted nucleic acid-binding OB-fold protein
MSGVRRDRNIKIPSRGNKGERSSGSEHRPSRPAEGRATVPKAQPKKAAPQPRKNTTPGDGERKQNNRQGGQRSGGQRQGGQRQGGQRQGGQRGGRPLQKSPLMEESWARVIDHDTAENVVVAISEGQMLLCRLEPKGGIETLLTTSRVYIGNDASKRVNIERVLGMTNLGRVANHVKSDLPLVIQIFIEENEKHFIDTFFNRAGNMSLKQHAFELLAGVGNKKAMQMVDARGSSGFESLAALNESCNIDAADLLAKRFLVELDDRNIQPRLIDLLLPVKA